MIRKPIIGYIISFLIFILVIITAFSILPLYKHHTIPDFSSPNDYLYKIFNNDYVFKLLLSNELEDESDNYVSMSIFYSIFNYYPDAYGKNSIFIIVLLRKYCAFFLMFPFFITILLSIAGSHRARLLWLGFLGCFFHFGFANSFFFLIDEFPFITTLMLRYLIISILSLAAFIDGVKSIDVQKIAERFRGWKPPWVASIYFEAKMIMLLLPTFILILMPFFKNKSFSLIEIIFYIAVLLTICLSMVVLAITVIQFRNKRSWGYVMAPILLTVDLILNFSTVAASIIIPILWPSVTIILLIIFLVKFKKSPIISEK